MRIDIGKLAALVLVVLAAYGLHRAGGLQWAENVVVERRMAAAPRDASGDIVFLAIDNRSLDAVGVWPWPRELYAEISRRLFDLGATEIFFDIDFSAASNEASDAALAEAFAEYGSAILLAAFRQAEGVGDAAADDSANMPIARFRDHAWLASVNVTADADGHVRRYPYGQMIEGENIASAAAMLAGAFGEAEQDFPVNFAIRPEAVPTYAVIDLLEGRLEPGQIEGRSIVLGSHAIELRDNLSVPVHGIVSGAMLQILAAETLLQGVVPVRMAAWPLLLVIAVAAVGAAVSPLGRRPGWLLAGFGATSVGLEAAGLALFARDALVVPTPVLHAALLGVGLTVAARELDLRRWLLQIARAETKNSQAILERIVADSSDAIIVIDEAGAVLEMSQRAHLLFGVPEGGGPLTLPQIVPPELAEAARAAMAAFRRGEGVPAAAHRLTFLREGRATHLEYAVTPSRLRQMKRRSRASDEIIVGCVTARDVTLAREQQQRLDHLARFDVLTGAMNRTEFLERLEASLLAGSDHAVFTVNLHRFKTINATLGRSVGDALLQAFVARVEAAGTGASGTARLGGDTFSLFCADMNVERAERIAEILIETTARAFTLANSSAWVGARIGIALGGAGGATAEALLGNAELALDEARRAAGNGFSIFDEAASTRQARSRQIERALWTAIDNGELYLAFQPQVRLADLRVVGAEALVRWTHPAMGSISPAELIEIAEGNGFIEKLGRWVLEQACRDAAAWPEPTTVAVNVSPLQFQRSDIVADVSHALAVSGLAPSRLHLEITESTFVEGSSELIETLHDLRMMGLALALDDFGSGFSSFGYLGALPLDKLKLDRMFMEGLPESPTNAAVVKSVAMLAAELGLVLVCEGVETEAQSEFLRGLRVDQGQGYFYGKPQPQASILPLFDAGDAAIASLRAGEALSGWKGR